MMTPPHTGDRLDHYLLQKLVARSGMASLFCAIDTRSGTKVAVKVPHPEAECDVSFFERFQREGQIGRELTHRGVVRVLETGNANRAYLVMEWAEGRLLREMLAEEGKLDVKRASRISLAICEALDYIHTHGVVHRDLKPENIMIGADDSVKLIDFGNCGEGGRPPAHV